MAGSSLLTLIDDIATLLDDVSVMTKVAAKKTAGVLGDDLALNAEQVTGVRADRELPVVWAVFKGSAINKLVMVPAALFLSAVFPWIITPLLMLGGAFLCYEGFEKVAHRLLHAPAEDKEEHDERLKAVADGTVDMVQFEKQRIKGAIRTDAILSAEIIVIALGTVQDAELPVRIATLSVIAAAITIGVYGLVAAIVKLDDLGMHLIESAGESESGGLRRRTGELILRFAPIMMKALSVLGTAAMFLVGGGILVHGVPVLANWLHDIEDLTHALPVAAKLFSGVAAMLFNFVIGIVAGGLLVGAHQLIRKLRPGAADEAHH
jgi:predicted DNA repair protein MutK